MSDFLKISDDFYIIFHDNEIGLRRGICLENSNLVIGKEKLNFTINEFTNFKFEYSKIFVALCLKKTSTSLLQQ